MSLLWNARIKRPINVIIIIIMSFDWNLVDRQRLMSTKYLVILVKGQWALFDFGTFTYY